MEVIGEQKRSFSGVLGAKQLSEEEKKEEELGKAMVNIIKTKLQNVKYVVSVVILV